MNENNNIIISTKEDFSNLHDGYYSNILKFIKYDTIHFKDINFNLLSDKILCKLEFNTIKFENCILGKFYNIRQSLYNSTIYLINQKLDDYSIQFIKSANKIYVDNIDMNCFKQIFKTHLHYLSISNTNIIGELSSIGKSTIDHILINDIDMTDLTYNDLIYLNEKMSNTSIKKIEISNQEIDIKKIESLIRKSKISKLLC